MTGDYDVAQNSEVRSNSMMNENQTLSSDWSGGITCARYPDHCTIRSTLSWENWGEGISTFESLHTTIEANTSHDNMTNIYISDTKFALVWEISATARPEIGLILSWTKMGCWSMKNLEFPSRWVQMGSETIPPIIPS